MAERTGIEWTDHTFSPWRGCTKISAGCANCYAEEWARRFDPGIWGKGATRAVAAQSSWDKPMKWNQRCAALGIRESVFPSLCDPFDTEVDAALRHRFWTLIRRTPSIDWLLLTKRPNAMRKMLPGDWGVGWPNVWLGVSVENQEMADLRIPILIRTPAAVRIVSYEPALGPVDFTAIGRSPSTDMVLDAVGGFRWNRFQQPWSRESGPGKVHCHKIDWVIAGGESTAGARAPDPDWFRSARDQCVAADVPFFFKQWGAWRPTCCPEGADTRIHDAAPEISIDHFRLAGDTLMERGHKVENGHVLDGAVWQQRPGSRNPATQSWGENP